MRVGCQADEAGQALRGPADWCGPAKLRPSRGPDESDGTSARHNRNLPEAIGIGPKASDEQILRALPLEDQSLRVRRNEMRGEPEIPPAVVSWRPGNAAGIEPGTCSREESVPATLDLGPDGNAARPLSTGDGLEEHSDPSQSREELCFLAPAFTGIRPLDGGQEPSPPRLSGPADPDPSGASEAAAGHLAPWSLVVVSDLGGRDEEPMQELLQDVADWIATVYRAAFPIVHVTLSMDERPPGWPHPKGIVWVDAMSLEPYANYGFAAAKALADPFRLRTPVLRDDPADPPAPAPGMAGAAARPSHCLVARGQLVSNHRLLRLSHKFGPPRPDVSFADRKPF